MPPGAAQASPGNVSFVALTSFAAFTAMTALSCGLDAAGLLGADAGGSGSADSAPSVVPDATPRRDATTPHDATSPRDAAVSVDGADDAAPEGASIDSGDAAGDAVSNDAHDAHDDAPHDADHDAPRDAVSPPMDSGKPKDAAGPNCHDNEKNGTETGVDCGGGMCAPCAVGGGCVQGSDCESEVCTGGACASCAPNCAAGATCSDGASCVSAFCANGQCATPVSCSAIHSSNGAAPNGAYAIDPDGSGGNAPFTVYCDMTDAGGGWTLVLKMGSLASPGTFAYDNAIWTNTTLLMTGSTDMSQTEAKFQSYLSVPFTTLLAMMTPLGSSSPPNILQIQVSDTMSLGHLIGLNTATTTTGITVSQWEALTTPTAVLQNNCNTQGIDVEASGSCADTGDARVRIGLIANNENDCCSPDSYVGFGGDYDDEGFCSPVAYSAGAMGGGGGLCAGGSINIASFGYVFVR